MSKRMDDGHSTTVSFSENTAIKLWEKEVTPPGVDGGGANDTTTMRNEVWRTQAPKKLLTLTDGSFTAAYDPTVLPEIIAMVNVNQQITITFPDGEVETFWGWLNEFKPNANQEGAQPTAECTIIPSNQDDLGAETAPTIA
jgi:hypothetical protein